LTKQELHRQRVDLSALAHQLNDDIARDNPARSVQVEIQEGLYAEADPRMIQLLLHNLFSNAWKFTSKRDDAKIAFKGESLGEEFVYYVMDNGAGFDMAYSNKLFEPFQRLHHNAEFPGSGVGLATANRVVQRHGGHTFAKGDVDKGATIFFTLPSQ